MDAILSTIRKDLVSLDSGGAEGKQNQDGSQLDEANAPTESRGGDGQPQDQAAMLRSYLDSLIIVLEQVPLTTHQTPAFLFLLLHLLPPNPPSSK